MLAPRKVPPSHRVNIFLLRDSIGDDELKDIYPLLLERLDDSQDPIRLKVTAAMKLFFSCRYIKLS